MAHGPGPFSCGSLRLDVRGLDQACPQHELVADVFVELRRILRRPDFETGGGELLLDVLFGENTLISVDSLSTISVGSPAGPKMPFQEVRSKPGMSAATGGTFGRILDPRAGVTAIGRTRWAFSICMPDPKSTT